MSLLLGPLRTAGRYNVRRELFSNNEQGLWLDPSDMTAGKAGWRRNLLGYSEGTVAQFSPTSQVTTASTSITGFSNSIQFGDNSVQRYAYSQAATISGLSYTLSVYVQMDDDSIPSVGTSTGSGDFNVVFSNSVVSTPLATVSLVSGSLYRISVVKTGDGLSGRNFGVLKNTGQSSKTFRVTGYQLELGSLSEYQPITDFSTEFKEAFPTHTLYQDSNGVTPCTDSGQPVGLILDQSRGGLSQIGADLVTNGTFAADSDWTKGANWTIGSGVATKSGGAANNLTQTIGSTAAAWYRVSLDVTRSAGTLTVSLGTSGTTYAITATGSYTVFILAGSGTQTLTLAGDSSFAGTVDNVVVRNVPGNHAYQTTSGQRPTLARIPSSGRRNVLTYSEQLDNAVWTKGATTVSANTAETTDPLGTNTADKILETTANSAHTIRATIAVTSGQNITFSFYAKAAGRDYIRFWEDVTTGKQGYFNLANGTATNSDLSSVAIQSVGNGWYRCSGTINSFAGTSYGFRIHTSADGTTTSFAGDDTKGVYLWGAQLETGSTATNYQKVVATTDVTESGFADLYHLSFDGTDDSLATNSVDFSSTDEMTVIAGARKLSDAALGMVAELSVDANTNNGSFYLLAGPNTGTGPRWTFTPRGTATRATVSPASYTAPITNLLTGLVDISSDVSQLNIDGTLATEVLLDLGSGNFGNYALYIGRRGGSSLPLNGHLYQLIVRGKTTPEGKLLEAERFVGRKTGVTGI